MTAGLAMIRMMPKIFLAGLTFSASAHWLMTTAERVRAFRQRQAERLAVLERENAEMRERAVATEADRHAAIAEAERLAATQCRHPRGCG